MQPVHHANVEDDVDGVAVINTDVPLAKDVLIPPAIVVPFTEIVASPTTDVDSE